VSLDDDDEFDEEELDDDEEEEYDPDEELDDDEEEDDREDILDIMGPDSFPPSDSKWWEDRDFCVEAVHRHGGALEFVPDEFKTPEMCLEAIRKADEDEKNSILELVCYDTWENPRFCLEAMQLDPNAVRYVSSKLWQNPNFCLEVIQLCGSNPELKTVMYDLECELKEFFWAKFWDDSNFCLEAIKLNNFALECVSPDLWDKPDFCRAAVKQNRSALKYVPDNLLGKLKARFSK
jgi:hypothetical protein